MATKVALRAGRARPQEIETRAWILLFQKRLSAGGLAKDLGVSEVTAKRIVGALRRQGHEIVSVRDRGDVFYEVRDRLSPEDLAQDSFLRSAGSIKGRGRRTGWDEDAVIYARDW